MMKSGNAVSSDIDLIPSETLYKKRGGLLWTITRKKNLIHLRLAAFFTVFVCNLVHAYKFTAWNSVRFRARPAISVAILILHFNFEKYKIWMQKFCRASFCQIYCKNNINLSLCGCWQREWYNWPQLGFVFLFL